MAGRHPWVAHGLPTKSVRKTDSAGNGPLCLSQLQTPHSLNGWNKCFSFIFLANILQRWFQVSNMAFTAIVALPHQSHLALVLDIWVYLASCARPKSRKRLAARTVTSKTQVQHEPNCWTRTTNFAEKKLTCWLYVGIKSIQACFIMRIKPQQEWVNICTREWRLNLLLRFQGKFDCTDGPCSLRLKAAIGKMQCNVLESAAAELVDESFGLKFW